MYVAKGVLQILNRPGDSAGTAKSQDDLAMVIQKGDILGIVRTVRDKSNMYVNVLLPVPGWIYCPSKIMNNEFLLPLPVLFVIENCFIILKCYV